MTVLLSFTESDAIAALRSLLTQIAGPDVEIIRTQVNRVPEPRSSNFIAMTPLLRTRLSMNVDDVTDVVFSGNISGNVLTVSHVTAGEVRVGTVIDGPGVLSGTTIVATGSGTGGLGTYTVSQAQTTPLEDFDGDYDSDFRSPPGRMFAGFKTAIQAVQLDVQLDIHGPSSADLAHEVSTLLWDEFATSFFDDSGIDAQVLYASAPRQMQFINGEAQFEHRWMVDVSLQLNQQIQVPQQFADVLTPDLISVDAVYPPL